MNNNIFFDIDGTLQKEDIFAEFIKHVILSSKIKLFLLFPIFLLSLCIYLVDKEGKMDINIILYCFNFNKKDQEKFISEFCKKTKNKITINKKTMTILKLHIKNKNQVFLISGTPEILIRKIYPEILMNDNVILIASDMIFNFNSIYLRDRCISKRKLTRLEEVTKQTVYFLEGYSDSHLDLSILNRCKHKFFVLKNGDLININDIKNIQLPPK